jgi:hypothetical protein
MQILLEENVVDSGVSGTPTESTQFGNDGQNGSNGQDGTNATGSGVDGTDGTDGVHKLYGAASNLGAKNLAQFCDEVHAIESSEYEKIQVLHPVILSKYEKVYHLLEGKRRSVA